MFAFIMSIVGLGGVVWLVLIHPFSVLAFLVVIVLPCASTWFAAVVCDMAGLLAVVASYLGWVYHSLSVLIVVLSTVGVTDGRSCCEEWAIRFGFLPQVFQK
jgi:hypothetical protein